MRVAFLCGKELRSGGNLPLSEQRKRRAGRHVFGELVARVSKTGNRSCWHVRHVRGKRGGFNHQAKMHWISRGHVRGAARAVSQEDLSVFFVVGLWKKKSFSGPIIFLFKKLFILCYLKVLLIV